MSLAFLLEYKNNDGILLMEVKPHNRRQKTNESQLYYRIPPLYCMGCKTRTTLD